MIGSRTLAAAFLSLAVIAGPALPASADENRPEAGENDDGEGFMRFMFKVNQGLDTLLVRPVATFYKAFTPPEAQVGIRNFATNLRAPMVMLNDMLQGEWERAGVTMERALINTTTGWFGFQDKATEMGIEGHEEDFGQTLATWGVDDGPYIVLPIFGPSNPRDTVGKVVDFLTMPPGVGSFDALDDRAQMDAELETLEKTSLDYYAALKSMYEQNRRFEIENRPDMAGTGQAAGDDLPTIE